MELRLTNRRVLARNPEGVRAEAIPGQPPASGSPFLSEGKPNMPQANRRDSVRSSFPARPNQTRAGVALAWDTFCLPSSIPELPASNDGLCLENQNRQFGWWIPPGGNAVTSFVPRRTA